MSYSTLEIELQKGWAILALNRPDKMNAISPQMHEDMAQALGELGKADIRALVITGRGRGFCSGADVSGPGGPAALLGDAPSRVKAPAGWLAQRLHGFDWPTIAAVNGAAVGAGLAIALACDIRICSDDARFAAMYVKRGLAADFGCSWLLPRVVGASRALELMFTGRIIMAEEAERIGLVSRVAKGNDLLAQAEALAAEIAQGPPLAIRAIKRATWHALDRTLEEQFLQESHDQGLLIETEDYREGVRAFIEKRPAQFQGR